MGEPKGKKLYICLPASQVRKRLKGFGNGVRKIQSAGRKQAVVVHTAIGHHFYQLQNQFQDVKISETEFTP